METVATQFWIVAMQIGIVAMAIEIVVMHGARVVACVEITGSRFPGDATARLSRVLWIANGVTCQPAGVARGLERLMPKLLPAFRGERRLL